MKLSRLGASRGFNTESQDLNIISRRLSSFRKAMQSTLNENAELQVDETVKESSLSEIPTFINNISSYISNAPNSLTVDDFMKIIKIIQPIVGKILSGDNDKKIVGDCYDSLETVITALGVHLYDTDSNDVNQEKVVYIDKIKALLYDIKYFNNSINESAFFISTAELNALLESVDTNDDALARLSQFFLEEDGTTIAPMLTELPTLIIKLMETNNIVVVKNLLDHVYDTVILNVSALRKFGDIVKELIDNNPELDKGLLMPYVVKSRERAVKNLSNPNYEYNVMCELGFDDIFLNQVNNTWNNIVLTEGISDNMKELHTKIKSTSKKTIRKFNSSVDRIIQDHRDAERDHIEDKIIKSTFDASYYIKRLLIASGLVIVPEIGPALALLYIIIKFATAKKTEKKYKIKFLSELQEELRLTQEKIKDAERDGNNKAKYKLMRLEMQLQRGIDKIKYNINTTRSESTGRY